MRAEVGALDGEPDHARRAVSGGSGGRRTVSLETHSTSVMIARMSAEPRKVRGAPFRRYRAYVGQLQTLMVTAGGGSDWDQQVTVALDGGATAELRRVSSLATRRKYGAYFTGTVLGDRLLRHCASFDRSRTFYDATCGMGDLLLSAAKRLPLGRTLEETLAQWGRRLAGTDLHEEFVNGARIRLALLARQRHRTRQHLVLSPDRLFPLIRTGDGFSDSPGFTEPITILLNPPFRRIRSRKPCSWANGRISEAAQFLMSALERARPGTEILAILPEVLRSGTFSEHWRTRVGDLAEVHAIHPYGVFDESADIDVFLLRLVRRAHGASSPAKKWPLWRPLTGTVAASFDIRVGRVVPHRDKEIGRRHPYIHARCVPPWTVMKAFTETRKHGRPAFQPPFVVVRRTSRPAQPYRATATVVAGNTSVAVENHLIVCSPKDGTLRTCKALMQQLHTPDANTYLDTRIRCRHLTVSALAGAPFRPS